MNRISNYKDVSNRITDWMEDYIKSSGLNCFVVGVSGGIDSAVASTLAAETKYNVIALSMPIHQIQINKVCQTHILDGCQESILMLKQKRLI